jgi:hypothetical protein
MASAEAPGASAIPPKESLYMQIPAETSKEITMEDQASVTTSPMRISSETTSKPSSKPSTRITIDDLPNELLSNIFGNLDGPQPSASAVHDEPTFDLTQSEVTNLKSISCVSKRWRRAILPVLFRHAQFVIKEPKVHISILDQQMQPFFDFVTHKKLRKVITSFTLLVHDKKVASSSTRERHLNGFSAFWKLLFDVIDPTELLIVAPAEALSALTSCHVHLEDVWCFDCPCQYLRLQRPPAPEIGTLPIDDAIPANEYPLGTPAHQVVEPVTATFSIHNIPEDLLKHPTVSAGAADGASYMIERASQVIPTSSEQPESSSSVAAEQEPSEAIYADSSPLFEAHPWSKLLLNEGSFIRAFATYEFWLRQPPSVRKFKEQGNLKINHCIRFYPISSVTTHLLAKLS